MNKVYALSPSKEERQARTTIPQESGAGDLARNFKLNQNVLLIFLNINS